MIAGGPTDGPAVRCCRSAGVARFDETGLEIVSASELVRIHGKTTLPYGP
jgi:hypothetical protein